jgi:hypothetical protein
MPLLRAILYSKQAFLFNQVPGISNILQLHLLVPLDLIDILRSSMSTLEDNELGNTSEF